ncbi:hypothetical protein G6F32_017561 [Rhizopus arrhizus]|nr:hypothetical protein G6F32_017561 [Rhizopus arrhizus]
MAFAPRRRTPAHWRHAQLLLDDPVGLGQQRGFFVAQGPGFVQIAVRGNFVAGGQDGVVGGGVVFDVVSARE